MSACAHHAMHSELKSNFQTDWLPSGVINRIGFHATVCDTFVVLFDSFLHPRLLLMVNKRTSLIEMDGGLHIYDRTY